MPVWPSAGQILQDQHKDQHMYGIKGIAGILERFAVIALPSSVQPDGEERQKCKPLLTDLKFHAENTILSFWSKRETPTANSKSSVWYSALNW